MCDVRVTPAVTKFTSVNDHTENRPGIDGNLDNLLSLGGFLMPVADCGFPQQGPVFNFACQEATVAHPATTRTMIVPHIVFTMLATG